MFYIKGCHWVNLENIFSWSVKSRGWSGKFGNYLKRSQNFEIDGYGSLQKRNSLCSRRKNVFYRSNPGTSPSCGATLKGKNLLIGSKFFL